MEDRRRPENAETRVFLDEHPEFAAEQREGYDDSRVVPEVLHDRNSSRMVSSYTGWTGGEEGLPDSTGIAEAERRGAMPLVLPVEDDNSPHAQRVRAAFKTMDEEDRNLLWSRFVQGDTLEQMVTQGYGNSPQAVDYRLRRARERLQRAWLDQQIDRSRRENREALDELAGQ